MISHFSWWRRRRSSRRPVAAAFGVEVTDQPWAREVELTDPDGNRLRIGTRRDG